MRFSARGPGRKRLFDYRFQLVAAKTGLGLYRHTVQNSHDERRQSIGVSIIWQVALGLCPLEALAQPCLARLTKLYQCLSYRLSIIRPGQNTIDTKTSRMVRVTGIQFG